MKVIVDSGLAGIAGLADRVEEVLGDLGVPSAAIHATNLCLEELITNTVSYGFAGGEQHTISVDLELRDGELRIELLDDGAPFDPTSYEVAPDVGAGVDERRIGGLGIFLVKKLMDSMEYERRGGHNRLVLRKRVFD